MYVLQATLTILKKRFVATSLIFFRDRPKLTHCYEQMEQNYCSKRPASENAVLGAGHPSKRFGRLLVQTYEPHCKRFSLQKVRTSERLYNVEGNKVRTSEPADRSPATVGLSVVLFFELSKFLE